MLQFLTKLLEDFLNLFPELINISVTAGYIVLAVIIVRLIFRKAPKQLFCVLWAIVALRLVLPINLKSSLSLLPLNETINTEYFRYEGQKLNTEVSAELISNPIYNAPSSINPGISADALQTKFLIFTLIWIAGLILMLCYAFISSVLLKHRMRTATLLQKNVKQSDRCPSPFVLGIIRPIVYLPYSISSEDIEYVIAHEKAHIKRKDNIWKPLGFIILSVYWFNPILWVAYILLCRDIEAACDEKVIKDMEEVERRAYSTALLNCSVTRRSISACPLAFGEVGVKQRIKTVINYKKPAFWIIALSVIICIAVSICFLTNPKDETTPENNYYPANYTGYRYPALPGTDEWPYGNHAQMVAFCQVPKEICDGLTTDELLQTVLSYPMAADVYSSSDSNADYYSILKKQFYALSEFEKRTDAAEVLQTRYEVMLADAGNISSRHFASEEDREYAQTWESSRNMMLMLLYTHFFDNISTGITTYQPTEVKNVSIRLTDISPSGATVIIKDTNEETYLYGLWYAIERETDGTWFAVETVIDNYAFDMIGLLPDQNQEVRIDTNWEWLYGKLEPGHYRLLKESNKQIIGVEFDIE